MHMSTIFLTGTDTEVGKTHVATLLLKAVSDQDIRCAGYKPIAAGAELQAEGLRNEDALGLQTAGNIHIPYELINPYCFAPAIAPHLAAEQAAVTISETKLLDAHDRIAAMADWVLVEGAGGWRVPIGPDRDMADFVSDQGWPVVLVVGMRLGCLNHALLSAESIARQSRLLGWVANCLPPEQPMLMDNIKTLRQRMPAPLLGVFPEGSQTPENLEMLTLIEV